MKIKLTKTGYNVIHVLIGVSSLVVACFAVKFLLRFLSTNWFLVHLVVAHVIWLVPVIWWGNKIAAFNKEQQRLQVEARQREDEQRDEMYRRREEARARRWEEEKEQAQKGGRVLPQRNMYDF